MWIELPETESEEDETDEVESEEEKEIPSKEKDETTLLEKTDVKGESLSDTATNIYSYLAIGPMLPLSGSAIQIIRFVRHS